MPVAGGEPKKLTDLKEDVGEPVWSPDGTRIAFTARVPDEAYEEEDDKKRAPRRFKRLLFKLDNVGWTGDRRRHLYVVPADGSADPQQLTEGDYEDSHPAWSPDGSRIAFASARGEDWDIELLADVYTVPAAGGEPERLTTEREQLRRARLLAGRQAPRRQVGAGRLRLPAPHADRRRRRRHGREPPRPHGLARPHVRPLPGAARTDLGGRRASSSRSRTAAACTSTRSRPTAGSPSSLVGEEQASAATTPAAGKLAYVASKAPGLSELYVDGTELTDLGSRVRRGPRARRAGALHGGLRRRHRGRRVDRAAGRVRGGQALPAPPEHPRRAVHPVQEPDSSTSSRSTRAPGSRSSTRTRAAPRGTPRSGAARSAGPATARPGLGDGRLRGRDGCHRRGPQAVRLRRPRSAGRDRRLLRRLHDFLDRRRTRTASRPRAPSAPSTTSSRCTARATSAGSSRATTASSSTTRSTRTCRCRPGRTRRTSRRRS